MIIIFCPRGNATGGTELLHQLGYKLNLLGFDAYMYYYGDDNGLPATHPHFAKYKVPVVDRVLDSQDNYFVYPEMMASSLADIKSQLPSSTHIIWWLSVDNAGMTPELIDTISKDTDLIHFVQSYYALGYVRDTLAVSEERLFYLSDYLNDEFLNIKDDVKRENVVLFNPRKGFDRTAALIKNSDYGIKWQALSGLSPDDVPGVLKKAKVYVDFGNHPGKDRFPREAVACGCRIITGRRGAAANDRDIIIPEQLKVTDDTDDYTILNLIYGLMTNYDKTGELYSEYRDEIREEFHKFEEDCLRVFTKVTGGNMYGTGLDENRLKNKIIDAVTVEDYCKAFYYLTMYRVNKYRITRDITILDGYTRIGIGEEPIAEYLMDNLLNEDEKNYEAHLIKARALAAQNKPEVADELDLAGRYSAGTNDEDYIESCIQTIKKGIYSE